MHSKWNKKVTLDLHQLKATLKKIILHPKKKDIHRRHLLSFSRHFVFFSGLRTFFNDCLIVAKKTLPSGTHTRTVNMFHLEKEETKLI